MMPFDPTKSTRSIDALIMPVKAMCLNHVAACKHVGIDLLITQTYRCHADQAALYAQGRTAPGRVVTNAKPGQSLHQYRVAYDCVPLRNGKPIWGTVANDDREIWQAVGALGKQCGLEWAGEWAKFKEFPHFQFTGGLTIAQLADGEIPIYTRLEKSA